MSCSCGLSSCGICSPCATAIALTSIGTAGPTGPQGYTAAFYIGSVTSGAIAAATLTLTQTVPPIYRLDFVLPVGSAQTYTTPQTFNNTAAFNGQMISTGTNTFSGVTTFSAASSVSFNGNLFFGGVEQASVSDCITYRLVVTSTGQVKGIQGDGATTYIGTNASTVTKAFDSTSDSAFGPVVNFSTACDTKASILVQVYLLNPGTGAGTPTDLALYTITLYDGIAAIGSTQVSNYQGGDILPFSVNLAPGNHSLNLAIAGNNVGNTGSQLSVTASTIRVDV
jgi:hypothetical protein